MPQSGRFAQFNRCLEDEGRRHSLDARDIMRLARQADLSFGEATDAVQVLVRQGRWQQRFTDEQGHELTREQAAIYATGWGAGLGGPRVQVEWRRCPFTGALLA